MEFSISEIGKTAKAVLDAAMAKRQDGQATVVTLSGDLGAGKTTLVTELAKILGVTHNLQSPTFVIYKKYPLGPGVPWKYLVHGDMYRLEGPEEIEKLGWADLVGDPENIVCIEWPEKIEGAVPAGTVTVNLAHVEEEVRRIDIS